MSDLLPPERTTVTVTERHRNDRLAVLAAVVALAALLTASVSTVLVLRNTRSIANSEKRDTGALRRAAYRICNRETAGRAELHISAFRGAVPTAMLRERQRRIPIVDCTPNLFDNAAIPLSPREQLRYVRFFIRFSQPPPVCHAHVELKRQCLGQQQRKPPRRR